ncbi:a78 [Rat cytomegalovirus ALL-03]|uniref:A78 n=2 Tax=Rat cytomegalovirus (isolate England) TaxID=1261657 RepID=A0A0F6TG63_RCMVE|nr:a78 [Rat cytomegalovirus ALL-03]WEG71865.1 envelope protein UL78 [Murid betaherpesvirus 8]WPH25255.1 envelope protein UL78 [Murid betaherpesvirus 8]WPH25388.1 envelope protein UL78 [Murid betaherpesvirus 8]
MVACLIPMGEMCPEEAFFIGVYNSVVTGAFSAVFGVATIALGITYGVVIASKRVCGPWPFVISLFLANVGMLISLAAKWAVRVWWPAMLDDSFCRGALSVGVVSESAGSFFFMFMCLDRMRDIERSVSGGAESKRAPGGYGVFWATVVAWLSALFFGYPMLVSTSSFQNSGSLPVCELRGDDSITQLMIQSSVVFVVPTLIVISRILSVDKKSPGSAEVVVRRACCFYMCYFLIMIPALISRTMQYIYVDTPSPSWKDYLNMFATAIYMFRVVIFAFAADIVLDDSVVGTVSPTNLFFRSLIYGDVDKENGKDSKTCPDVEIACLRVKRPGFVKKVSEKLVEKLKHMWGSFGVHVFNAYKKKSPEGMVVGVRGMGYDDDAHELNKDSGSVFGSDGGPSGFDNPGYVSDGGEAEDGKCEVADQKLEALGMPSTTIPRDETIPCVAVYM